MIELQELCKEAHARKGIAVRLLGVGVSFIDLREADLHQLDLFDENFFRLRFTNVSSSSE